MAAFKTMLPYAILCSTSVESSAAFLMVIVRRLKDNDYPRKVVVDMWDEAVASMLFQLPCRFNFHAELGALPGLVKRQIELLFRS